MNYKIIGGDGKEYGPISGDQLRQWMSEGRLNGQSMAKAEGSTDWKALSSFPEFADVLGTFRPPTMPATMDLAAWQSAVLSRDYDVSIGNCISRGWNLVMGNFITIVGGFVIYFLIQFGISLCQQIPLLGILVSLGNFVFLAGPLQAGLYYFLLRNIRREPAEIGDIFAGFRRNYWQLVLGYVVVCLLMMVAAIPGGVILGVSIIPMAAHHDLLPLALAGAILGFFVMLIPIIYLSMAWIFALALIIDRQMEFWPAMELSRKTVGKHWWMMFALLIVCGLLNIAGLLACCVGLLISVPVTFGALMYAYEDIFSAPVGQAA